MSKKMRTWLIVAIVVVILVGAVAVYAGNGAGRSTDRTFGGQNARVWESNRETRDEDCTEEAYALNAGNGGRYGNGGIISDYADLTGVERDDVMDAMRDSDLDIWELAEQEGNFEALKAVLLADLDAHIADETDPAALAELTAHRDAVAAATTAAEMPEDYEGGALSSASEGGYGKNR